ncbi:UNVERIFIED_CONTAM: LINE-1 reverse transcriptase [Sesamum latifolium]|uniref:LINE-1 reverse transcriptase n=1 Tax=Sesamum latifolium TaxID=2727402 RepID=A0AAW2XMS7_9LAMI
MQGELFTWHNCSYEWPDSVYRSLAPRTSDHSPLLLTGYSSLPRASMFHFDNYLAQSPGFIQTVQDVWRHNIVGTGMYAVTRKLKALKPVFMRQRRNKGDLLRNVQLAKDYLAIAQRLISRDRQNSLLLQLEYCCQLVLLNATKLEQSMLQQQAKIQWLKGGDQCTRVFFRRVARRRATKRIFQIQNEGGMTIAEHIEVTHEFVSFYQRLLGGERDKRFIDLCYLRPWVRYLLTEEDLAALTTLVTAADVKMAFFDIPEDKSPGPDGYSSGFFKAAWPIVGDEVTRAVLDFFHNGKLLRQVNATLLVLIPKQHLPPRCALKVDLRKAYDTVEWDFMLAALCLFRFPCQFIAWIEECITTASFSVCLNGTPHGFFVGARGLRQGDPMSPYLFVLVMEVLHLIRRQHIEQDRGFEYHWRCKELSLSLCFADDLLL